MKQSEAVRTLVKTVVGEINGPVQLTGEQRSDIIQSLMEGLTSGEIDFSDAAKAKYIYGDGNLKVYASGLLTNWLKKDLSLNGGVKYKPENPGSRAGQGDSKLKELKKLLQVVPEDKRAIVQAAIEKRIEELAAEKAKSIEIDLSQIPEHLRDLLG